jgi:hypothetical protein
MLQEQESISSTKKNESAQKAQKRKRKRTTANDADELIE